MALDKQVIDKIFNCVDVHHKDKHYRHLMKVKKGDRGLSLRMIESLEKEYKIKVEIKVKKK